MAVPATASAIGTFSLLWAKSVFLHAGNQTLDLGRAFAPRPNPPDVDGETGLVGVARGPPQAPALWIDAALQLSDGDQSGRTGVRLVGGFSSHVWAGVEQYTGVGFRNIFTVRDWGSDKNLNNTIVGALKSGQADVSVNYLAHCCNRMDVHDLSATLYTRSFSVVFRRPELAEDVFSAQFGPSLWLAVAATLLALLAAMCFLRNDFTWKESVTWIFCLVSQQGHESHPSDAAGKLLFFSGFVFGLLTFGGFSAGIISTLTTARSIETFRDLLEHDDIRIYGSAHAPFNQEIADSNNGLVKWLHRRMVGDEKHRWCAEPGRSSCDGEIMSALSSSSHPHSSDTAYVAPDQVIYNKWVFPDAHSKREKTCSMSRLGVPLGEQTMMYGFRRGLDRGVRSDINRGILRLREVGILGRILRENIPVPPAYCEDYQRTSYKPVSIKYVFGAYAVLGMGWLSALAIAALESLAATEKKQNTV